MHQLPNGSFSERSAPAAEAPFVPGQNSCPSPYASAWERYEDPQVRADQRRYLVRLIAYVLAGLVIAGAFQFFAIQAAVSAAVAEECR